MEPWQVYLEKHQSRFISELCDFISIPSVSADPTHADHVLEAANWVSSRLKETGSSVPLNSLQVILINRVH